MTTEEFQRYTDLLVARAATDPRVLGLVALGSMADRDYAPDAFSDHDFFLVVRPGEQEAFRRDLRWLPGELAFTFRETPHGLKVLLSDGHLLEFAVFDPNELYLAKVNRYRTLLDRADIEQRMSEVRDESSRACEAGGGDDAWLLGQTLAQLLVAAGRASRGEVLSGRALLGAALRNVLVLLERHVPSAERGLLDGLDPHRRFERAYPELGRELGRHMAQSVPLAARGLLDVLERELRPRLGDFPARGAELVRAAIARMA